MKLIQFISLSTLLGVAACDTLRGYYSSTPIQSLPSETCVGDALLLISGVENIKVHPRETSEIFYLLPRKSIESIDEMVTFEYQGHSFFVRTTIDEVQGNRVDIPGAMINACPEPSFLNSYSELMPMLADTLSTECFNGAQIEMEELGNCPK